MTTRAELPRDKLIQLARQTLGYIATSSIVPEGYLDELRKHVKFCKDDTRFRVIPHQGNGYGLVQCLENGCEAVRISLHKRAFGLDDGLKDGIGSLSAYRVHVEEHPTHKSSRFARVRAEACGTHSFDPSILVTNAQTGALSHSLSTNNNSTPEFSSMSFNETALSQGTDLVFPSTLSHRSGISATEPGREDTSVISSSVASPMSNKRKRASSMNAEDKDIIASDSSPHGLSKAWVKKAKLEGIKSEPSLTPLGDVDPNHENLKPFENQFSRLPPPDVASVQLAEANRSINSVQKILAYYVKKTRKSRHDRQQIDALEQRLRDEGLQVARCKAALQANSSAASQSSTNTAGVSIAIKQENNYQAQPFTLRHDMHDQFVPPVASGSNAQLPAASFPLEEFPNASPGINHNVLSDIQPPNYGDTMDYGDDFYGSQRRSCVPYRGPVADPGDIEKFLVDSGNSELFDGNESVDKALEKLGLKKLGQPLPDMTIALMPHQVIGVAWMKEHELGRHRGGILADEMGLGKTVQMIAMMVQHRSGDPAVKSTLICAPVALLDQWKSEIDTKTKGAFKCLIYHGPSKPKTKAELQKYDIVLTTFQTLALEYNDPRVAERKKAKKRKMKGESSDEFVDTDSEAEVKTKKEKGLLLRMSWFRVVLDEAQNIRNRNTRISIAVTHLDAKHRWCLTGTPVTNSLADCYGLIRFLQIRPWYDWEDFNIHIARIERRQPDLASTRLQAILNSCLLRRKKDSLLDGKKLIELPPKEVVLRQLEFSNDERDIYNAVEAKSRATFNRYLRAGTVLKNYAHVLVLLLRLRQLCSHPCLIQEGGNAFVRPDEDPTVKHEAQTELERAAILAGTDFVKRMKAKLKAVMLDRMAAEKKSAEAAIEEEDCPVCFDGLTNPIITRCGHVFCADCIATVLSLPAVEDGKQPRYAMSERPCPTCREPVQKEMLFQRSAFEPTDADLAASACGTPIVMDDSDEDGLPIATDVFPAAKKDKVVIPNKVKGKPKPKKRFSRRLVESDDEFEEDDSGLSDFIVQSDEEEEEEEKNSRRVAKKLAKNKRVVPDLEEDTEMEDEELLPPTIIAKKREKGKSNKLERFLPSTKMKEMMVLLKSWADAEESKNEKTMVLSQWTSCLDLVADYLHENGFTFVRFQGDMSRSARDEAVRTFMSQGKARIMLMSLKCGGVGLNLTRANRVISLDLGWSPAVESQAFDRVHRLGQVRPVTVQRLVIENTVEARILALQERKQSLADGSLGEGSGKKLGRLSVKDLANLFGLDARGQLL